MNCLVQARGTQAAAACGTARTLKNATVLLVEDHEDTRGFLKQVLRMEGCKVLAARTRDQARVLIEEAKVDVILLDYFMPGMSAFTFITLVRDSDPNMRIVLMSAAGYARDAGRMLGVAEVIEKPVTPEHIYRLLCV